MINWNQTYDSGNDFRLITSAEINYILKYTQSYSKANTQCLDIGSGTGHLTRELWHRGFKPTGIDISESAIRLARQYTKLGGDEITYLVANLEKNEVNELIGKKFALITCKLVYAFIDNKQIFLENVSKLMNDRSIFAIITPLADDVPPVKKHIAVDFDTTVLELRTYFNLLSSEKNNGQVIFICQLKS